MSTTAGRKKSVISSVPPTIDSPVANNTLLNKAASQSTSLYQQCSALRNRLTRVHGFNDWFSLSSSPESSRRSTDPVTQLWDCFILGVPLCFLFNLLPEPYTPINIDTDPTSLDLDSEKTKKRAVALFSMQLKQIEGCEQFTVTELLDRNSSDGLIKVVNNVIHLVELLPSDVFVESPPQSPALASAQQSTDSLTTDSALTLVSTEPAVPGFKIIQELVDTERKYVQDLENLQKYSNAAAQSNIIDLDTLHLLFPNLNKLLNFQRKFLIKVETTAELPWDQQRWGFLFTDNEEEFQVYETYCANFTCASDIALQEEQNLAALNHVIHAKGELPAFLIKPVQRICKYPLLLESLVKALRGTDYTYYDELEAGVAAAKRITDKINEAQRRAENFSTVKNLETRVEDWKGHHISNFGALLLDDVFSVTKSEVDREYHVFLFEKIILCCKECPLPPPNGKKVGKSNSILKKPTTPLPLSPGGAGPSKQKNTPLLLKGRIFLNNVTQAVSKTTAGTYSLAVWWRGDDDLEFFTLRCRNEEQLRHWENSLNKLIQDTANRRNSERSAQRQTQLANLAAQSRSNRASNGPSGQTLSMSSHSPISTSPVTPGLPIGRSMRHPYAIDESSPTTSTPIPPSLQAGHVHGPQGYPPHDGFDVDQEDDYEDYPPTSALPASGRGTPIGNRRPETSSGYPLPARNSAHTISSYPNNVGYPGSIGRPSVSRNTSSFASDVGSFGPGVAQSRGSLRSQFSSTKLKSSYDQAESRLSSGSTLNSGVSVPMRSRSASQPSAYVPINSLPPPPLPSAPWADRTLGHNKRGSGSSQSTGDSSDSSPHTSSSPITPYGSSESSLQGLPGARPLHGNSADHLVNSAVGSLPVKVKVHFHEDIFVIQVPRSTEYAELVEKVGKKIRLCGPRRDDGPLRVKYKDEDGDLVSLGSTEDVQMAFESIRPGAQVTLFVQ
ncbi:hypothetical protein CERSUDRAFT_114133 [Gelatoporia subvermispora B]|uniref:DH domain-containing protein n=1 Tax=Ceriporiopsis subvermispora (strain B) TaxID=914234 RepID=M2RFB3_CERS8|nr:hypothetical protein CERSUDRAFT_114133 [Gelatoporia subvermispora B]